MKSHLDFKDLLGRHYNQSSETVLLSRQARNKTQAGIV